MSDKRGGRGAKTVRETSAAMRSRRPQAERSAETQGKLIEAAIACLHSVGYSQTTVGMVADAAGVSRGALTHQYPSKVDLMLAVVRSVSEANVDQYSRLLDGKTPMEAVLFIPQALWRVTRGPATMAVIEIILASRSDAVLTEKLRLMQADLEATAKQLLVARFMAAGLEPPANADAVFSLFVAAARGLAIESIASGRNELVDEVVELLTKIFAMLLPDAAGEGV